MLLAFAIMQGHRLSMYVKNILFRSRSTVESILRFIPRWERTRDSTLQVLMGVESCLRGNLQVQFGGRRKGPWDQGLAVDPVLEGVKEKCYRFRMEAPVNGGSNSNCPKVNVLQSLVDKDYYFQSKSKRDHNMSKYMRVYLQEQPWGYARAGDTDLSASLSVQVMGALDVTIGDVVAISHVWGDAKYDVENVQGASHQIKISSPEKMRRIINIAKTNRLDNLWLDNICINQDDDDERSREVMKMGYLYRQSKATVILLHSTRSEILRETIPMILRFQGQKHVAALTEVMSDAELSDLTDKCALLGNDEWYARLWTMQESTLPTRIYMAPIDEDILYDVSGLRDCKAFLMELLYFVGSKFGIAEDPKLQHYAMMIDGVIYRWVAEAESSMIDALLATCDKRCSESKDRVYGILGLVRNVSLIPAYGNTTPEDVAVMVMKECVNRLKQMDLLHIQGRKMKQVGKRIVPSWSALKNPTALVGRIHHQGNCTYDENVGLMISSPRVFRAEIVTVIEPDIMLEPSVRNVFTVMKQGMVDDEIVQLIRGTMFTLGTFEYWKDYYAHESFRLWSYIASLPHGTNMFDVLESQFSMDHQAQYSFLSLFAHSIRAHMLPICARVYILRIRKDNSCPCSCCRRTYISVVRSPVLQEDNLIVVDYGGHFVDEFPDLETVSEGYRGRGDRIPLIVAESEQGGKAKFISTIVQDRGLLHESMTSEMEAITIV